VKEPAEREPADNSSSTPSPDPDAAPADLEGPSVPARAQEPPAVSAQPESPPRPSGKSDAPAPQTEGHDSHTEFARLLATQSDPVRLQRGALVKGTVVQIGETDLLVDVGGKREATIARAELLAEDGSLTVKIGDTIEATVVSMDGSLRLSRKLTSASAQSRNRALIKEQLTEAFQNRMPVRGRVTASVKGGYEVQVSGMRGFCPFSQIDVRRQEDPTLYFNKTFDFLIKEYEPRKRNLILSRRALIESEARKQETAAREKLTEGAVLDGTVVSLQDFGAFVDLGSSIQGLLHVSEISHTRVAKPSDLLSVGQALKVQVLRVDKKKGKISLTRKPLEADPWSGVERRLRPGQVLSAKTMRMTEFGAFLELAPGVDGLLHISELSGRKPEPGQEMTVQVIQVDAGRRRVSLGLAPDGASPGEKVRVSPLKVGEVVTGKVERVEKFGVFLRLGAGRTGMIPNNEMGTQRGADHRKMFPPGTELTAEVIQADPGGRKIRLSVDKAKGREEREAVEKYRKDASKSGAGSFSTLADAFGALKKPTS